MAYSIRLENGQFLTPFLPDWQGLKFSGIFSDSGTVSFDYAVDGINAATLKDQSEISIWDDLGELPDTRSVIESSNGSVSQVGGVTYRSFSARTLHKVFEESLVYTADWPNSPGDGKRSFTSKTPGAVMSQILYSAQQLGELSGVTWDFSSDQDSAGNNWRFKMGTYAVEMGVNILQVMQNLVDQGLLEIRMIGRVLQAFNPGTSGRDRAEDAAGAVVLWSSQNTIESPEQTDSRGLRSVAIVKGDDGKWQEVIDATAKAKYGRRAMFISQGGVKDSGTLTVIGQASLDRVKQVRSEKTHKYRPEGGSPVPFRDFSLGDWVLWQGADGLERVRVRQLSVEASDSASPGSVTLTLNDLFLENEILVSRKINGITGGANNAGGTNAVDNTNTIDTLAPAVPQGLTATSDAYATADGRIFTQVSASWAAVVVNSDGSAMKDFDHYEVQWRYVPNEKFGDRQTMNVDSPFISFDGLLIRRNIHIRVRAVDQNSNKSPFSAVFGMLTAFDAVPPPMPSRPVLDRYLGATRYTWDGKGSAGEAMPPDFSHIEIHASPINNFTPSPSNRIDSMMVGGSSVTTEGEYGSIISIRFVAFDVNGNKSDPSDTASITRQPLVDIDIGRGSVTEAALAASAVTRSKIAANAVGATEIGPNSVSSGNIIGRSITAYDLQTDTITAASGVIGDLAILTTNIANAGITNAKIANLAVNSAKITDLEVAKLTSGVMSASVVIGGSIRTSNGGNRVEMNSLGLFLFDAQGNRKGSWDTRTGDIDMTGTFRTTSNGGRSIIITNSLIDAVGLSQNQAGLVFKNTNSRLRYSQMYDNGVALTLDSPAINSGNDKGVSVGVASNGFFVYTEGGSVGAGLSALEVRNDGQWIIGSSNDRSGRAFGNNSSWTIATVGGGTRATGNSSGSWKMETISNVGTEVYGNTDGTWGLGDFNNGDGSRVYGSRSLWVFGVQGGIGVYGTNSSWRIGAPNNSTYASGDNQGNNFIGDSRSGGVRLAMGRGTFTLGPIGGNEGIYTSNGELIFTGGSSSNGIHFFLRSNTFFRVDGGRGVYVNGDLSAFNKQFRIQHPDDESKLLVHGTTESPEPGVHYWGEAVVGKDGSCEVALPTYFEGLTLKDRRSALVTAIGAPVALGASRVAGGAFTVRGEAGTRFSWLVQAVRSGASFDPEPNRPSADDGSWFTGHGDTPPMPPQQTHEFEPMPEPDTGTIDL